MAEIGQAGRRRRSAEKHTAMLDAAQEMFLLDGYDGTSVDAIAIRAGVSKRTVYDHFGEKELVYLAVVDRVSAEILLTVHASIEDDLRDGCDPRSGLLAFARRVAALAFSSSEYALIRAPVGARGRRVRGSVRNAPKELFVERIARFVAQGVLGPAEPWRVAEHFIALTFLLALDLLDTFDAAVDGAWNELDELLVDGVDAFLRAYARAGRAAR